MNRNDGRLWLRWTAANAAGEMLGLGLTFAVIGLFTVAAEGETGVGIVLLSFLVAVAAGAIEATLVGLAQWWAMRPAFPMISAAAWWRATLIGALIAYVLGYLPSTIMSLGADPSQAPPAEPPQAVVLLLAAGMGAIGGAVLSFAQWRVLRGQAARAALWIPANMIAWTAGMPIIFAGVDIAFAGGSMLAAVPVMAGTFLLAGAVVGAIHGLFLVWLARSADREGVADGKGGGMRV